MHRVTEDSDYNIRYTIKDDLPLITRWLHQEHEWCPVDFNHIIPFAKNWIQLHLYRASLTAIYKNMPVGIAGLFPFPYRKLRHICDVKVFVSPDFRLHGVGSSLVKNINHLGKNYFHFEKLHMEVFEGNLIIPILESMGYQKLFEQKNFVKIRNEMKARIVYEIDLESSL